MAIRIGFPQIPSSKVFWETTNSRTLSVCLYPDTVPITLTGERVMGKIKEGGGVLLC